MKEIKVTPINVEEVENSTSDVQTLVEESEQLIISSQEEFESASGLLTQVKTRGKELDKQRKSITNPLDEAKKNVMELFRKPIDLLKKAEDTIKRGMLNYTSEQERKAREEEERLRKLAEKQAEEERKRLEKRIERAENSGKEEKAEELKEQLEYVKPIDVPVVAPNVEKPKGVSYRMKYTGDVVDFSKLPDSYKVVDQSKLNKVIQASGGSIEIPGVKIKSEKILSQRI
jgi:hypothetical protein